MLRYLRTHTGISLIELIVTITILGILAAGVMPLIRNTTIRTKEIELRRNLRIIRIAIDDCKKTYDKVPNNVTPGNGLPKDLKELVDGIESPDKAKPGKVKYLRRKVLNPLNPKSSEDPNWGWELRCYKDEPDSTTWCGDDVYDVYAPQDGIALDGTKYNEW
jgi:general secretion pathway protein G